MKSRICLSYSLGSWDARAESGSAVGTSFCAMVEYGGRLEGRVGAISGAMLGAWTILEGKGWIEEIKMSGFKLRRV